MATEDEEMEVCAPADKTFEGLDLEMVLKQALKRFQFLVCGKTGVGKSSLINSLVGREMCRVNDPGMPKGTFEAGTTEVKETLVKLENVIVSVWDSPGLQDGTDNEEKYLENMYEKCKDVDIVLYCMDMTIPRWTPPEVKATKLLTERFGVDFWKKAILVLTKANTVRVPGKYKGKECVYHQQLYHNFTRMFRDQLIKQGVPEEIAKNLRTVAAGFCDPTDKKEEERFIYYASEKVIPSKENEQSDFLAELWVTCLEILSGVSRAKFVRMTRKRIKPPEGSLSEEDKKLIELLEDSLKNEKALREKLEKEHTAVYDRLKQEIDAYKKELERIPQAPPISSQPAHLTDRHRDRLAGAAFGAAVGSVFGPVGAMVGGFFGGLFG